MAKEDILYIPGLGGRKTRTVERTYLRTQGVFKHANFYFFDPHWETDDSENNDKKYQRLEDFFDEKAHPGIIYANSAGAALAIRLAVAKSAKIESCHLVCGKVLGAAKIGEEYSDRAPAFVDAVMQSELAVARMDEETAKKIFCYVPKDCDDDGVIEVVDMKVPGAHIVDLPTLPHARAIIYAGRHFLPNLGS